MISNESFEYIRFLCGQPLYNVYRAVDMGCFDFGENIVMKKRNGLIECSSIALHLQCPFRLISKDEKIIFTAFDMYLSHNGERMDDMSWDVYGVNLFDKKSKEWFEENSLLYVRTANINKQGDLKIIFNNEDRLEVFINNSTEDECWRFFERNSGKKHMVISGFGDVYE